MTILRSVFLGSLLFLFAITPKAAFNLEEAFTEGVQQVMHHVNGGNTQASTKQKRARDDNKLEHGGSAQLKHKKAKRIPLKEAMAQHAQGDNGQGLFGMVANSLSNTLGLAGGIVQDFVPGFDFNKTPSLFAEGSKYMRLMVVIQTTVKALTEPA